MSQNISDDVEFVEEWTRTSDMSVSKPKPVRKSTAKMTSGENADSLKNIIDTVKGNNHQLECLIKREFDELSYHFAITTKINAITTKINSDHQQLVKNLEQQEKRLRKEQKKSDTARASRTRRKEKKKVKSQDIREMGFLTKLENK